MPERTAQPRKAPPIPDRGAKLLAILPKRIEGLARLATNLWWSWHREARLLFRMIHPLLWRSTRHRPIRLLERVESSRLVWCAQSSEFLALYDHVMERMEHDLASDETWFASNCGDVASSTIAYFCAEFGLHNSVPIYSGGLGVLAGDHCKAASDLGVPMVGIGLFYTKGYFDQRFRLDGWQEDFEEDFNPAVTPLTPVLGPNGDPHLAKLRSMGRNVHVGAWKIMVGRVPVFLLDTNLRRNRVADRELCHKLYGGGLELRLRQEWILGVGGVRVLRALGIHPTAWHANEGHAAFNYVERLREATSEGTPFDDAVRQVRASSVFTTHTPVPAGHDSFTHDQVSACAEPFWDKMSVSREAFLALGRHPDGSPDGFHMTALAIRLAGRVNGVAQKHGEVTREIWSGLWPGREPAQVPIGHVTNGVHLATWMAPQFADLLETCLGSDWVRKVAEQPELWEHVLALDNREFWRTHFRLKSSLIDFIREEARRRWKDDWQARHLVGTGTLLSSNALTIGFARRFATYKRANLMFRDPERLRRMLVNPMRPVQIVFAGKAHPADDPGKTVLRDVYAFTRDPQFDGRIALLEGYDMHIAHRLVQGVDIWLNLPTPPLEASGTSGMKAGLNGVPQISTPDGWWLEGYDGQNGWAIDPTDRTDPDAADAEALYTLLEEEVVPLFYDSDEHGVPHGWVQRMKHTLRTTGGRFTARRMMEEYVRGYYVPAARAEMDDDPPTM